MWGLHTRHGAADRGREACEEVILKDDEGAWGRRGSVAVDSMCLPVPLLAAFRPVLSICSFGLRKERPTLSWSFRFRCAGLVAVVRRVRSLVVRGVMSSGLSRAKSRAYSETPLAGGPAPPPANQAPRDNGRVDCAASPFRRTRSCRMKRCSWPAFNFYT